MTDRPADLASALAVLEHAVLELAPGEAPAFVTRLAALLGVAGARLAVGGGNGAATRAEDRLLTAREVHQRTTLSVAYLYRHAAALPFARRIGRRVLFDEAALTKWLAMRRP
jgi:predicted DNA-binding transcriptional regulator AlpA